MLTVINGLPAHVLLIHVIVVLAPLGALFTVLSAAWPAAHRKLGIISPLTCLVVLIFVPITTNAGDWLRRKLDPAGRNAQIQKHANLGHTFLWFAIGLFVVSAAVWWLGRRYELGVFGLRRSLPGVRTKPVAPNVLSIAVLVVSAAMSIAAVIQLYRVGDSGAQAAWSYVHQLGK